MGMPQDQPSHLEEYRGYIRRTGMRRQSELPPNLFVVFPTWKGLSTFRYMNNASWMESALLDSVEYFRDVCKYNEISLFDLFIEVTNRVSKMMSQNTSIRSATRMDGIETGMKNTVVVVHNLSEVVYFKINNNT